MPRTGLVLTGGGARAAFQVGVLRGMAKILKVKKSPFEFISGFSAGAINGAWLAAHGEDFDRVTQSMWNAWAGLTVHQVFRTDLFSLVRIGSRWIKDLGSGGLLGESKVTFLLDNSPLASFLGANIDFREINRQVKKGNLHGLSVTAVNYKSGQSVTFYEGEPAIAPWARERRVGAPGKITLDHIMASTAIPVFFPPVEIGGAFYGDGMIRLNAPLSSTIHMGARRIVFIGMQCSRSCADLTSNSALSLGDIIGTLFNGLFFDSVDTDLERMERINRTLSVMTPSQLEKEPDHLFPVPHLAIRPSIDLGRLASDYFKHFPRALRHLLTGLGVTEGKGLDILSYLSFDTHYATTLLEIGFQEAMAQKDRILEFFGDKTAHEALPLEYQKSADSGTRIA